MESGRSRPVDRMGCVDSREGFTLDREQLTIFSVAKYPSEEFGLRVLSLCAGRIRVDFSETYGYEPVPFETFVEKGRYSGACYRAAIGFIWEIQRGSGKLDRNHKHSVPVKAVLCTR